MTPADALETMTPIERIRWLLEPGRNHFEFWVGCGYLAAKWPLPDASCMEPLYEAACRMDRSGAETILRELLD